MGKRKIIRLGLVILVAGIMIIGREFRELRVRIQHKPTSRFTDFNNLIGV
ncbi:unnamed protein product [marine sediment metagenome]|uniref:Uncharacterized protein n=1 Tax=marine sediment metagenome TaxID=412755 RepID=X1PW74_9ZZZZ